MPSAGVIEHALEVVEELRQPMLEETGGLPRRVCLLVLVTKVHRDRVMRVVDLADQVGDRQLQLVGTEATRLVGRNEAQARAEVEQDVRDLRDDERVRAQERRREGLEECSPRARASRP